jgi:hypothetical protein
MPFAAAALVAPHSVAVSAVIGAELVVQLLHRRSWLKSLFNLAQFGLGTSFGILAYRRTGGFEFTEVVGESFFSAAQQLLVPATFLVESMLLVNTLSVSSDCRHQAQVVAGSLAANHPSDDKVLVPTSAPGILPRLDEL